MNKVENDNMYGYNDYEGPMIQNRKSCLSNNNSFKQMNLDEIESSSSSVSSSSELNPLIAGLWMDGDSLAPPCGASIPVIHSLLELAELSSKDVLYDLGCGDGRVCLEAFFHENDVHQNSEECDNQLSFTKCRHCVGVEIEYDLIERFRFLIDQSNERMKEFKLKDITTMTNSSRSILALHKDLCQVLDTLIDLYANESVIRTKDEILKNDAKDSNSKGKLPKPTIISIYLLPESIEQIQPKLVKLMKHIPELKIVCNSWGLKGMTAAKTLEAIDQNYSATITLYDHNSLQQSMPNLFEKN